MVYPIVQVQCVGNVHSETGIVNVNGQDVPPFRYHAGSRQNGSVFFSESTGLFIKLGALRAEKERAALAAARAAGVAEYFAPIILSGPDWNAFAAIEGTEAREGSPEHERAESIARKLGIWDVCGFNVIVQPDGQPVIIDYEYNDIAPGERVGSSANWGNSDP